MSGNEGVAVPTWGGVILAIVLVVLAVVVTARARLGISRELGFAAAWSALQLVAVAAVLGWLFTHAGIFGGFAWLGLMIVLGGQVAARRGAGLPRVGRSATIGLAAGVSVTVGSLVVLNVISVEARVLVPVGGMVVSGAMQASGLALRAVREQVLSARPAIEARLSLGLHARDAFAPELRMALQTALIPTLDSTKTVGIIALPGAMTGLILAGVDPLTAVRYQIVVMWMLLSAVSLSALVSASLAQKMLFDSAHRLRHLDSHQEPFKKGNGATYWRKIKFDRWRS